MVPHIHILDEVKVKIKGVNSELIKEAQKHLTYYVPGYNFMPSFKLGRWDGKIRLMTGTGLTYLNLLDDVLPYLENKGYDFDIIDDRKNYQYIIDDIEQRGLPDSNYFSQYELKGKPVVLRDYQVEGIHTAIQNGTGLLEMSTGSGKTLTTAVLSKFYSKYGNVVLIVPNIDLAVQTQSLFRKVGIDAGLWYGEVKDRGIVTISTWQSLDHYPELFSDVICVIVDEAHKSKGKTLGEILTEPGANVPFRFGCTGTLPKEDIFRKQIFAAIGPIIFDLPSWELQQLGVLAKSKIIQIIMKDSKNPRYPKPNSKGKRFDDWSSQVKWFFSQDDRTNRIAEIIKDASEVEGNNLILVENIKTGEILEKLVEGSKFVNGSFKGKERIKIYEQFNIHDNGNLICTMGIASTGIDIPRLFVITVIEPGKKFEKVLQIIGRGLRKEGDKDFIIILDICGDSDFSKSHAHHRIKIYENARHDYEIIEVEYHDDAN